MVSLTSDNSYSSLSLLKQMFDCNVSASRTLSDRFKNIMVSLRKDLLKELSNKYSSFNKVDNIFVNFITSDVMEIVSARYEENTTILGRIIISGNDMVSDILVEGVQRGKEKEQIISYFIKCYEKAYNEAGDWDKVLYKTTDLRHFS